MTSSVRISTVTVVGPSSPFDFRTMFPLPGDVHLWCGRTELTGLTGSPNVLSDDERERASRYRFARDKERFTAARAMLRRILAAYLDVSPEQVSFTYSPNGKPAVTNSSALQFNLSHSGDLAVCAVSASRRIGVDIEQIWPVKDMESVFRTISSRAEQAEFDALLEAAECGCVLSVLDDERGLRQSSRDRPFDTFGFDRSDDALR